MVKSEQYTLSCNYLNKNKACLSCNCMPCDHVHLICFSQEFGFLKKFSLEFGSDLVLGMTEKHEQ